MLKVAKTVVSVNKDWFVLSLLTKDLCFSKLKGRPYSLTPQVSVTDFVGSMLRTIMSLI